MLTVPFRRAGNVSFSADLIPVGWVTHPPNWRGDINHLLRELEDLYIPTNERSLRRVQRKGEELDKHVRGWSHSVMEVLPRGLPLNPDERYVVSLFLAQQRRLNLQMDAFQPDNSLWGTAKQFFPFLGPKVDPNAVIAVHRIVAMRIDSDIERTARFYCEDRGIPGDSDLAVDWRVALRFMAQSVYSRIGNQDPKKLMQTPGRFELALVARDLAGDIEAKRQTMLTARKLDPSVPRRRREDVA